VDIETSAALTGWRAKDFKVYLYLVEQPFERQTTVPLPFSPRISLVPPAL
jgi:hypothetical protein